MSTPFADTFIPFFGVIEENNDPENIGRVRVRCYGYHSENKAYIPTDYLQWFTCVISNSAGVSGIGQSPTGYVKGSTVFGYFLDKTLQEGIVVGAINAKPTHVAYTNVGFNDPDGMYPRYVAESDVNRLARENGMNHWLFAIKESNRIKGIQTAAKGGEWSEPEYKNQATYPNNHVYESESGHIKEYDDTEGQERIHEYHRSGTYEEIGPDGEKVTKIVGDEYEITAGKRNIFIGGNVNLTIGANVRTYIQGDSITQIDGDKIEYVQGSVKEYYLSDHSNEVQGDYTQNAENINLNSDSFNNQSGRISQNEG